MANNYWQGRNARIGRRRVLTAAGAGGAAVAAAALIGCGDDDDDAASPATGGGGGGEQPRRGGMLTRTGLLPPHFDVQLTKLGGANQNFAPAYSTLLTFKAGPEIKPFEFLLDPELALSWEQPSPTEHVFKIRDNAYFHETDPMNGRKLVAEDIKWSYERIMNPTTKSQFQQVFQQVERIEAPDATTLKITMKRPDADLLYFLAGTEAFVVGREGVEKWGDLKQHVAGSGPFIFDSYTEGAELRFKRNPKYYVEGKPYFDSIRSLFGLDPAAAEAAFFSGQTHTYGVSLELSAIDRVRSQVPDAIISEPFKAGLHLFQMYISSKWGPGKDPRVRRAFQLAINHDEMIKIATIGQGYLNAPISPAFPQDTLPESEVRQYKKFDPQQAKQLLEAAGQSNLKTKTIFYNYGQFFVTAAQLVERSLKQAGIEVSLQQVEYGTQAAATATYDYETLWAVGAGWHVTPHQSLQRHAVKDGLNWTGQGDAELDKIIDDHGAELDEKKRREIGMRAQRMIWEKAFWRETIMQPSYSIVGPKLRNWSPLLTYGTFPQVRDAWLAE